MTPQDELLIALKKAYYSGQLSIKHGDKSVTYQSAEAMWLAIKRLEAEIDPDRVRRKKQIIAHHTKGL